jgi:hypothetical protein
VTAPLSIGLLGDVMLGRRVGELLAHDRGRVVWASGCARWRPR